MSYESPFAALHIRTTPALLQLVDTRDGSVRWSVAWEAVNEIAAWKEDAYTVDHIYLGFCQTRERVYYDVNEEMTGWSELLEELSERFGIDHSEWWRSVVAPAFATRFTIVWSSRVGDA